jgi:uncharacterized membrane protein
MAPGGKMMRDVARAMGDMIATLFVLCVIFVPLGLWKAIEIIIWLIKHIHVGLK